MNTQGIGLGLVICENIVKSFGGAIGVSSRFKKGSMFVFSIQLGNLDKKDDLLQAIQKNQVTAVRQLEMDHPSKKNTQS